jgi:hypothetical protein
MQDTKLDSNNILDQGRRMLRGLSEQDFRNFGVNQIAYIKPLHVMNRKVFGLYGADGGALAVIDSFDGALVTARQNDLEPVTLQ